MLRRSDLALWVKSFGAEVSLNVNRRTTHVIANPDRKTTKVKKAARNPNIKIVNAEWMLQCCTRWEHVDETPYLIDIDPAERGGSPFEDLEDTDIGVTGDEDGVEDEDLQLDMSADKWASLDDEFQDFMNESEESEDNSGSDSESIQSDVSVQTDKSQNKKKRKRKTTSGTESGSEADDSDASVNSSSRLQRRKKRTLDRVSSLTNVVSADKSSGLPSPETTGPEEEQGEDELAKDPEPAGLAAENSDEDDGLEAEMLAEFERSASEDA
jgi:RNA polymerase II subunit A-like phosphatase